MEQFGLAYRILPGAGIDSQHNFMRRIFVQLLHHTNDFFQFFHQVRFVLQTPCGISDQHIYVSRLRRLNSVKDNGGRIRTGMLSNHRNIVTLTPDLQLLYRRGTESIARRQHH